MTKKKVNGRPTKYKESMCDESIKFLAQGKSLVQLAAKLDVHTDTIQEWKSKHEKFSVALKRGIQLSEAHWQDKLTEDMYDTSINSSLYKLYFANRFGWSDKVETKNENSQVDKVKSFSDMYG